MWSVFVLGAFGWWVLTGLFVIYVFFALDKEKSLFWPIALLITYVLFSQFLAKVDIFSFAVHHPGKLSLYVLGYFVIGFVWSFVKWWLYVSTIADKCREKRKEFLESNKGQDDKDKWSRQVYMNSLNKPNLARSKKKISLWVMYWPVSAIWSLLDDFIKKMIRHLITKFQKIYQYISDRAFKGIDVKEEEE